MGGARALRVQGADGLLDAVHWPARDAAAKSERLVVFLHGGNFMSENRDELEGFFEALRGDIPSLSILAPRYTLATESPFPTPLEDVYSVLRWATANKAKLGWSGRTLVIAGIEAGASLAAAAALVCRDRNGPRLAGQVLLMPMLDPGLSSHSMLGAAAEPGQSFAATRCASGYRCYLPNAADRMHPYATPLNSSRLKGLPPTLIFSADGDPLRDEAETYGARLIAHGVRTAVVRLPPIALDAKGARTECASSGQVVAEIAGFLQTVSPLPISLAPTEPPSSNQKGIL